MRRDLRDQERSPRSRRAAGVESVRLGRQRPSGPTGVQKGPARGPFWCPGARYCVGDVGGERRDRPKRSIAAYNRRDVEAVRELWRPRHRAGLVRVPEGRRPACIGDGSRSCASTRTASRRSRRSSFSRSASSTSGDWVVVPNTAHMRGRRRHPNRRSEPRFAYEVHGGLITPSIACYQDTQEALEAAGLSGVGDVGGERGDRAAADRGAGTNMTRRLIGQLPG